MSGRIAAVAAVREDGKTDRLRRRGLRRRVEVARRRHDLQAGLRQAAGAVDRRDRDRSDEPEDGLGRHRRGVDAQLASRSATASTSPTDGGDDLDATWACRSPSASRKILVDPTRRRHRLRLRARQAVERQRRPRPLQDDRRRQDLGAGARRARTSRPAARCIVDGPARTPTCSSPACGTSAARAGRSAPAATAPSAPSGSGLFQIDRRRRDLDRRSTRRRGQGPARQAVGPRRGRGRAVEPEGRLRVHRVERELGALPLRRRRRDLGGARHAARTWSGGRSTSPPDRRPDEPEPALQARPRPDRQRRTAARASRGIGGGAHGDWHDLWIDPDEHRARHRAATTAGSGTRYDGGNRWWKANNLPISQFYHVSVDDKDSVPGLRRPAGQQLLGRRLARIPGGITNARWENLYGGDGFWTFVDPTDPDYVYAEAQGGYDRPRQPQDARDARHPAAGRLQGEAALQLEHADPRQPDAEGHDLHRRAVPVPLARPRRRPGSASRRT